MGKKTDVATALANAGMAGYGIKGSVESKDLVEFLATAWAMWFFLEVASETLIKIKKYKSYRST